MLITTEAFVLRQTRYDDRTIIADMLCEECGRVSFLVRLPKTKHGGLNKAFFQPMTLLEIAFDLRKEKNLQHLRSARTAMVYKDIPFSPSKLAVTCFLAEFLQYVTRDEDGQTEGIFTFIRQSMQWYDRAEKGYGNFHLIYIMEMMRYLGFYPEYATYREGNLFDMREGVFSSHTPSHPDHLTAAQTRLLVILLRTGYDSMSHISLTQQERNDTLDSILRYCRLHLPVFPDLRSLPVLREMFAT